MDKLADPRLETDNNTGYLLQPYGIFRQSTLSIGPVIESLVRPRKRVLDEFIMRTTREGRFDGSTSAKALDPKSACISDFFRSLKKIPAFNGNLERYEEAIRTFRNSSVRNPLGVSKWEDCLRLCLDCGVSSKKSSLTPGILSLEGDFTVEGNGESVDNRGIDDARYYGSEQTGEVTYNRASRNCTIKLGREITKLIKVVNEKVMTGIERRIGVQVPFINVDYRIIADSIEDITQGNYQLVAAEIHPDCVDFINDGLIFERNALLPKGLVFQLAKDVAATLPRGQDSYSIICPKNWEWNALYRTEISTLANAIYEAHSIQPLTVDTSASGSTAFNYPPVRGASDSLPDMRIIELLNNRREVMSLLEEAVSGVERVKAPTHCYISSQSLPRSLRAFPPLSRQQPSKAWYAVQWLNSLPGLNGFQDPLYVVKPLDHSQKGTKVVTLWEISGFNTVMDMLQRYNDLLVEKVDYSPWMEKKFNGGSVSELKTLSVRTHGSYKS